MSSSRHHLKGKRVSEMHSSRFQKKCSVLIVQNIPTIRNDYDSVLIRYSRKESIITLKKCFFCARDNTYICIYAPFEIYWIVSTSAFLTIYTLERCG